MGKFRVALDEFVKFSAVDDPHTAGLQRLHIDRVGALIERGYFGKGIFFLKDSDNVLPSLRREAVNFGAALLDNEQSVAGIPFPKHDISALVFAQVGMFGNLL